VHAHYVPLTLLSLAIDYRVWGLDPFGYHLTNVVLHAITAVLVCIFLWPIMPSIGCATFAALLFAVHPLQLEAVSLAIQRKTVLSGALFFATLIAYQAWRRDRHRWQYAAAVAAFAAAAAAKPSVVMLPALLCLYEYTFIDGRVRWRDKVPFVAIAVAAAMAAAAAHAAVGAMHAWHGGTPLAHVIMMARVTTEYLSAAFVPVGLSPIYYYRQGSAFAPVNVLAALILVAFTAWLVVWRRRAPWTFFCFAWFVLALLPESNVVPLAQLRADRFLYLPLLGATVWIAVVLARIQAQQRPSRAIALRAVPSAAAAALIVLLALQSRATAPIWRSDVTAWSRVVDCHPWCGTALLLLGHAYRAAGDAAAAEGRYHGALALAPGLADAHVALARLYAERGKADRAETHLRQAMALTPESGAAPELAAALRSDEPLPRN